MPASKITPSHEDSPTNSTLTDLFSRTVSYLRLSLTDRCNLQCIYCVPDSDHAEHPGCRARLRQDELLSYEELVRVVRVAVSMGISKLRLTGGEPLVRRDIMYFIAQLGEFDNLNDIRITTNGVLLDKYAEPLAAAGVRKINISLDTLKPERFLRITGADCFAQVWQGIEKARSAGFSPIKLNMVVMRGINDDELEAFAGLSQDTELQVRFIEFMPIGASSRWKNSAYMPSDEIMERIQGLGELIPVAKGKADGPATMFRVGREAKGKVGFISPISHHFCDRCNRLRLTSEGKLRSCLLHDRETDLRSVLRRGGTDEDIRQALLIAVRNKPKGHQMEEQIRTQGENCHGRMFRIGG
ncbi:MAG: GTP 3',8-cyclase MoaA [Candidatus Electrothrix sp. YB6]